MAPEPGARVRLARRFVTRSAAATEALGEALGRRLEADAVLALHGELGSGKTTLVRGLARGLEVVDPVSSPTFTLMHSYRGRLPVHHLDAWMQERGEAFLLDGGAEWLSAGGVALVEWAERVGDWLPLPRLALHLEHAGGDARRVRIEVLEPAPSAASAAEGLAALVAALQPPEGAEELPPDEELPPRPEPPGGRGVGAGT